MYPEHWCPLWQPTPSNVLSCHVVALHGTDLESVSLNNLQIVKLDRNV